jgi:hypothetical protein
VHNFFKRKDLIRFPSLSIYNTIAVGKQIIIKSGLTPRVSRGVAQNSRIKALSGKSRYPNPFYAFRSYSRLKTLCAL